MQINLHPEEVDVLVFIEKIKSWLRSCYYKM